MISMSFEHNEIVPRGIQCPQQYATQKFKEQYPQFKIISIDTEPPTLDNSNYEYVVLFVNAKRKK